MGVFLKFTLPSQPRFLALVRAAVGELGAVYGLPDQECRGVTLAVDEALANVIRHAYHGDSEWTIELNCHAGAGRGTHLIRMAMDEVCYERVPGGNQLRLSKRLPIGGGGAEEEGLDT